MAGIREIWRRWFHARCQLCKDGRVYHIGEDIIKTTRINVYECDRCGEMFV